MTKPFKQLVAVVPAAGVGKRMKANCPKQYLKIDQLTILEHTVFRLLAHPNISLVIIAISQGDEYFPETSLANHPQVSVVIGGQERVDSVLAGLKAIDNHQYKWALVHDAARPCIDLADIDALISSCETLGYGGILATPVRDTMKRSNESGQIIQTEERNLLWHALTPQMYQVTQLIESIEFGISRKLAITDESSAIELAQHASQIVQGRGDNIKITHPDDLDYAKFILKNQARAKNSSVNATQSNSTNDNSKRNQS